MKLKKYLDEEYLAEGGGRFEYASQLDQEMHRTLQGMVKNNGLFKSMKQRAYFLFNRWKGAKIGGGGAYASTVADLKKYKGITTAQEGEYYISVEAYLIFGQRGAGQGTRFLTWGYIIDDVGVREKYRLYYIYYKEGESSGTKGVDTKKTKLEWKRQENKEVQDFRELVALEDLERENRIKAGEAQLKNSQWMGVIGERVKDVEVEVIRKHFFETRFGTSAITVMKTVPEGNMIHHFGSNSLKRGEKRKISFTVKDHEKAEVNQWNKIPYKYTSVQRVK